jgi:ATP-dependent Lhr-like helicase
MGTLPEPFAGWFARHGWAPRPFQLAMLAAAAAGESTLLIAPTGGGKSLTRNLSFRIKLVPTAG